MSNKNYNRIKIVLAEKNLPNKYLAEKLGRAKLPFLNGLQTKLNLHWKRSFK